MRLFFLATLLMVSASHAQPPPTKVEPLSSDPKANLKRSEEALSHMRSVLRDVLIRVEEAKNTKDLVKLNCVNTKLTNVKGLLRISEGADVAFQEALTLGDRTSMETQWVKVMIAEGKVAQLGAEAQECIGQLAYRTDEQAVVEVETPEGLPSDDPTTVTPPPDVVVRPPPASPTL